MWFVDKKIRQSTGENLAHTYSSEDHVERHRNVKDEGVVVEDTHKEVESHHHHILTVEEQSFLNYFVKKTVYVWKNYEEFDHSS